MSRGEVKRRFTIEDHVRATQGVECRKDPAVIEEAPMGYKPIESVMAAQSDLVEMGVNSGGGGWSMTRIRCGASWTGRALVAHGHQLVSVRVACGRRGR